MLAAVLTLGIGFSSVRLSFVAGPPGGSAFIGGNSDRVGDESSSQKAGGSCASGVACGAMTSNGRAQWVALKNPALGRGRYAPAAFAGEAKFERLASCGEDWRGYEDQLGQFPNFGRAGQQELVFRTVWPRRRNLSSLRCVSDAQTASRLFLAL